MITHKRLYDNHFDAVAVIDRLRTGGIEEDAISLVSRPDGSDDELVEGPVATAAGSGIGAGGMAGGIVDALRDGGMDAETAEVYAEAIRRGDTLVTVRAEDADDALVTRLLDQTPAVGVAERERLYRDGGRAGFDPNDSGYDEAVRRHRV